MIPVFILLSIALSNVNANVVSFTGSQVTLACENAVGPVKWRHRTFDNEEYLAVDRDGSTAARLNVIVTSPTSISFPNISLNEAGVYYCYDAVKPNRNTKNYRISVASRPRCTQSTDSYMRTIECFGQYAGDKPAQSIASLTIPHAIIHAYTKKTYTANTYILRLKVPECIGRLNLTYHVTIDNLTDYLSFISRGSRTRM